MGHLPDRARMATKKQEEQPFFKTEGMVIWARLTRGDTRQWWPALVIDRDVDMELQEETSSNTVVTAFETNEYAPDEISVVEQNDIRKFHIDGKDAGESNEGEREGLSDVLKVVRTYITDHGLASQRRRRARANSTKKKKMPAKKKAVQPASTPDAGSLVVVKRTEISAEDLSKPEKMGVDVCTEDAYLPSRVNAKKKMAPRKKHATRCFTAESGGPGLVKPIEPTAEVPLGSGVIYENAYLPWQTEGFSKTNKGKFTGPTFAVHDHDPERMPQHKEEDEIDEDNDITASPGAPDNDEKGSAAPGEDGVGPDEASDIIEPAAPGTPSE